MVETAIINASPLIFLGPAGHLPLLQQIVDRCLVPEPVLGEILRRGVNDKTARALALHPWLTSVPAPPIPETIAGWGLGPGESSVLALALAQPARQCVV